MCDELGEVDAMEAYVIEAGGIVLCSVQTGEGCNDKEKEFIEKWKQKDLSKITAEWTRLKAMKTKKMNPELSTWLKQRIAIIKQLATTEAEL